MAAASDRRSSMSSIRSAISRNPISSGRDAPPQLKSHRPASLFTAGSSISTSAPPIFPSKGRLPAPMTPKRKPIQRQKSPLSSEPFSSPASVMPGTFPDTPPVQSQQNQPSYATDTTPASKSSKRLSSMRGFFPFRSMRNSSDNPSPDSSVLRPLTPGSESMASSPRPPSSAGSRPSLRKKMSGTFWKRKSSLGTSFMVGDHTQSGQDIPRGPETYDTNDDIIMEDSRPTTPALAENLPLPIRKRKSATFWRRKSSLTLAETMNVERQGWERKSSDFGNVAQAIGNGNGHAMAATQPMVQNGNGIGRKMSKKSEPESEKELPSPPLRQSSPPPQLPEFVGGGGGLGLDDDWFKGIN